LHDEDLSAHNLGVPIVMLGEHALDVEIDRIAIDNVLAAHTAVTHLLELGRRRIACIGHNRRSGIAALRLRGYRDALGAAGLPVVVDLVAPAEQYSRRDGAEAMRRRCARCSRCTNRRTRCSASTTCSRSARCS
jgi:DNA-binding LacI/PurR family transcriptional regulator